MGFNCFLNLKVLGLKHGKEVVFGVCLAHAPAGVPEQ